MRLISPAAALFLACLLTTAVLAAPPEGENPASTITGVVFDPSGAVVPGAAITLRVAGQPPKETWTDRAGRFVFWGVAAGPAKIVVAMPGFAAASIEVDRARPFLEAVLQPLGLSEQLTVRPEEPSPDRITTATRTDTPLRDVPQAITVVTREAIADQSMQGFADLVRYVPGVSMGQGEGNRDAPILRGNSTTADFFVDGVRDDVQYVRDLYNVERVEALKGANAMIFGRGGAGGVFNRVTRQANWSPVREATMQAGSFGTRRMTLDVGHAASRRAAVRLTGMYENTGSYRHDVGLERYGLNPTIALTLGKATTLTAGLERFHDGRTADRGIPSFAGKPVVTDRSTFFGNADSSLSDATVTALSAAVEHRFASSLALRSQARYADYDKFYQNVFPGAVNAAGTMVAITAYNNGTARRNVFSQTDLTLSTRTGGIRHTVLAGTEIGRQATDNLRHTGYFSSGGASVTSVHVPLAAPTTELPLVFRQAATDADNHGVARVMAIYLQDQVVFSPRLQAVVGLRYDHFEVDLHNNRTGAGLQSVDGLLSPRVGIIYKPAAPVSLYTSYSVAHAPRAGEQLSSLSPSNQSLEPERFTNYEIGSKWDIRPALAFTAALYQLDRTNVAIPDPLDPALSILVDGQRSRGLELGLTGRFSRSWSVMAAYAFQHGIITHTLSTTATAGARLAQLPAHTFSVWNRYDVTKAVGAGVGVIHRSQMYAAIDNSVVLGAFTRVDAAVFVAVNRRVGVQANIENLLNTGYYASAHSNNNIMPGSPRAVRVSLTTGF